MVHISIIGEQMNQKSKNRKSCILVVGPESSGTRVIADIISQHPDICSHRGGHDDILNEYWNSGNQNILQEVIQKQDIILTRRSMPSGYGSRAAKFLEFDDLEKFALDCDLLGVEISVVITTRSPQANLISWQRSRVSVSGSISKAISQYQASFKHLFLWLNNQPNILYWVISLEGCIHEGRMYFEALYELLGLNHLGQF